MAGETGPAAPWRSEKIWLAVIGLGTLVALGVTDVIRLEGYDVVAVVAALILGRAWEGVAARRGAS
jgi:hypothetical protein